MEQLLLFKDEKQNKARYEVMSRLPVFSSRYRDYWSIVGRAFRLDQDFNCHQFIQKKNLITGQYIGGWNNFKHK